MNILDLQEEFNALDKLKRELRTQTYIDLKEPEKVERNKRIKTMKSQGKSTRKIGKKLGISNKRVWDIQHNK